ncbi:MAG: hypothetical protein Crog4KO_33440 [Crocinitomicaceae bacterium]
MKTLFTVLLTFFILNVLGQTSDSVVVVVPEQYRALNGGARSQVGGKSRTYVPVTLPEGTKYWYYSYSTFADQSGTDALNLAFQITTLLTSGGSSSYSGLASKIKIPHGTGSGDVYLLDRENIDPFLAKDDLDGGTFDYYMQGSVFNTRNATVGIDAITEGTVYLGLKNPATWDALHIHIEVVAIVDNSTESSWTPEAEDMMFNTFVDHLRKEGMMYETATDLAHCMTEHLKTNYTLTEVGNLSASDEKALENELVAQCFTEGNECENSDQAQTYGNLGWTYFEKGAIENCIKFSEKALEKCPENMSWVEANIGLSYLVLDSADIALDYYIECIASSRNTSFGKEYIKGAIDDLEKYSNQYPSIGRHPEIIDLLKLELE